MPFEGRVVEQCVEASPEPGERARGGAVDAFGAEGSVGAEVDQPHRLAVGVLREGVRERRARVAHAFRDRLAAVEMAEGHVVDAVEDSRGDGRDTADGDVAFAVAGFAARHEGVGEDNGACAVLPGGEIGPYPVHGRREDRFVPGLRRAQAVADEGGFQVGQAVERHVAARVGQHDRGGAVVRIGPEVDARPRDQSRADAEPAGGVVVPGDHDGRHTGVGQPVERVVEQLDGGERWYGPVVDVARHDDHVGLVFPHGPHQVVEERGLGVEHRDAVERPPQVPVRGVQDPHDITPTAPVCMVHFLRPGTEPVHHPTRPGFPRQARPR